jgi:hypothetical protein
LSIVRAAMDDGQPTAVRVLLAVTRVWLPLGIATAGAVAVVLGHGRTELAAAGVVLLGSALIVWMLNWLFRLSLASNRDREREEDARRYFDRHGRWPDDGNG